MLTPPEWFSHAISHQPSNRSFNVGDKRLSCLCWGDSHLPALIFLHGGYANAYWFSHIAPQLSARYCVIALNFSGHGTSDWRDAYHTEDFLSELSALYEAFSLREAVLIGFSFGARVAYWFSLQRPSAVKQLVFLDPPNVYEPISKPFIRQITQAKPIHYYARDKEILKRFRLIPKQPVTNTYIVDHIAQHAIKSTPQGYTWQTDPNLFFKLANTAPVIDSPAQTLPPCVLIYGEHSTICTDAARHGLSIHHPEIPYIEISDAYHAIMIDAPQVLIEHLKSVLI